MSEWPRPDETLFVSATDWQHNACVSRFPTFGHYAYSFYESARALAETVGSKERDIYLDAAIYPITFMYRHYVELSLKHIIAMLRRIEESRNGYPKIHDLTALWAECRRLLVQHYSVKEIPGLEGMERCVSELARHDPDSMSFRYPTDRDGNFTLQGVSHINLRHLYEAMERVNHFLESIGGDIGQHLDYVLQSEANYES